MATITHARAVLLVDDIDAAILALKPLGFEPHAPSPCTDVLARSAQLGSSITLRTVSPALAKFGSPTLQAIDIDVRSLHVLQEAVSHNEGLAYVSGNGSEPARSQVPGTECRTSVWIPAIRTVVTATLKTTDGVVADNSVGVDATIDGAGVVKGSGAGIGAGAGAEAGAGPAKSGAATGLSAAELRSMFQHTATSMIMALGHRTGLTDTMAGLGSPVSIKELATASGCAERYVKEWLGGLVAGKMAVITSESTEPTHENNYGDDELRFQLTESTAKHFPRSAGLTCMGRSADTLANLGEEALARVAECFKSGGGVNYEHFSRTCATWGCGNKLRDEHSLVKEFIPTVQAPPCCAPKVANSGAGRVQSMHDVLSETDACVCDVGCGSGDGLKLLAKAYPKARFFGYEFRADTVAEANEEAARLGLANLTFIQGDAANLAEAGLPPFDWIMAWDAMHDMPNPPAVARAIFRALKPGGMFSMMDVRASSSLADNARNHPGGSCIFLASMLHCTTVSIANGGPGLGALWGRERGLRLLQSAGFAVAKDDITSVTYDELNEHYRAIKPSAVCG